MDERIGGGTGWAAHVSRWREDKADVDMEPTAEVSCVRSMKRSSPHNDGGGDASLVIEIDFTSGVLPEPIAQTICR